MTATEYNFDGLVGPTHHYAGLAFGNPASMKHRGTVSNPRAAALEGLRKMKLLYDLGVIQALLPPHERPSIVHLRRLGFTGSEKAILTKAYDDRPGALAQCSSASAMWAANAATISPSADTVDGKVHCLPANLAFNFHRSIEVEQTASVLKKIFEGNRFIHHPPLKSDATLGDEGAANHLRLCSCHGEKGIEAFVHGKSDVSQNNPTRFPARQTLKASQAVAQAHQLDPNYTVFVRQNPIAIDAGVFHNDVIAVSNENILLAHEMAFSEQNQVIKIFKSKFRQVAGDELIVIQVSNQQIPLKLAVKSYLFNSQIVSLSDSKMAIICPDECLQHKEIQTFLEELQMKGNPISEVHYVPLAQSMRNGGGPACLRLRVVLTVEEQQDVHPGVILSKHKFGELESWIRTHYRDSLTLRDFGDPEFLDETRTALDELTTLLNLGSLYPFQRHFPLPTH